MTNQPIVAWAEIPVSDMDKACAFYSAVFDWKMEIDNSGPNPMAVFNGGMAGGGGHLYPGKPATENGPTVHLTLPGKLEDAAARVGESGGAMLGPVIEIPAGRFQYATDPDGNSIGLFELGQG